MDPSSHVRNTEFPCHYIGNTIYKLNEMTSTIPICKNKSGPNRSLGSPKFGTLNLKIQYYTQFKNN